jgi:hypothetical protein
VNRYYNAVRGKSGAGAVAPLNLTDKLKIRVLLPDAASYQTFMNGLGEEQANVRMAKGSIGQALAETRAQHQTALSANVRGTNQAMRGIRGEAQTAIAGRQADAATARNLVPSDQSDIAKSVIGAARVPTAGPESGLARGAMEGVAGLHSRGLFEGLRSVAGLGPPTRYGGPVASNLVDLALARGPALQQQIAGIGARREELQRLIQAALLAGRTSAAQAR